MVCLNSLHGAHRACHDKYLQVHNQRQKMEDPTATFLLYLSFPSYYKSSNNGDFLLEYVP